MSEGIGNNQKNEAARLLERKAEDVPDWLLEKFVHMRSSPEQYVGHRMELARVIEAHPKYRGNDMAIVSQSEFTDAIATLSKGFLFTSEKQNLELKDKPMAIEPNKTSPRSTDLFFYSEDSGDVVVNQTVLAHLIQGKRLNLPSGQRSALLDDDLSASEFIFFSAAMFKDKDTYIEETGSEAGYDPNPFIDTVMQEIEMQRSKAKS